MGRHDSKHKKRSSRKKSHKRDKKKHEKKNVKHSRKDSGSSSSELSGNSSRYEERKFENRNPEKMKSSDDESEWNDIFSDRCTTVKEKTIRKKKDKQVLDRPGQSSRELNPYWKDGGNGLPPADSSDPKSNSEKKNDVKYLKSLLEKAVDTSEATGVPVKEIIEEEWGPMEMLKEIIQDEKSNLEGTEKGTFEHPASSGGEKSDDTGDGQSKKNFMKPGEMSDFKHTNTYKRNWKKKDAPVACSDEPALAQGSYPEEADGKITTENKSVLTPDELNALTAKAMKAEIMGDKALCEQLMKEIEAAKKVREEMSAASDGKSGKGKEEVIILTKTNLKGMTMPCKSSDYDGPEGTRKRRKEETHKDNVRVKYFLDDDKHSLKSMFEKEKFSTGGESDEALLEMAKRGKIHDGSDLDDDYLDEIRSSNYERKEREKERNKTINEATFKNKCVSNCRWCMDSGILLPHLVASIGTKCYLRVPSEESLVEDQCFIVPIYHDTCGTSLDEDVWNEIQSYRERVYRMFKEHGQDVIFFENARSFHRFPHMVLRCVPVPKEIGELAPMYFKKAIMESETEWSNNVKLVELKSKDLRRSIPKGLPYFAVDFGMEGGFAHVIEDEKLFPRNFAEEIIGGMLDLDTYRWKKPRKESMEKQKEKAGNFLEKWLKYEDETDMPESESDSSSSD